MNTQSITQTERKGYLGELIFAIVFYVLPFVGMVYTERVEILGQTFMLGSVPISSSFVEVIGVLISLLITARIREIGSDNLPGFIAWPLFVLPIIPIVIFLLIASPFFGKLL